MDSPPTQSTRGRNGAARRGQEGAGRTLPGDDFVPARTERFESSPRPCPYRGHQGGGYIDCERDSHCEEAVCENLLTQKKQVIFRRKDLGGMDGSSLGMDGTTRGPERTHTRVFRRIPGSDWFAVIAFMLAVVILGPLAISVGSFLAGILIFAAISLLPTYFWLRPRRH